MDDNSLNNPMFFVFTHLIHYYYGNINYSQFKVTFFLGGGFTARFFFLECPQLTLSQLTIEDLLLFTVLCTKVSSSLSTSLVMLNFPHKLWLPDIRPDVPICCVITPSLPEHRGLKSGHFPQAWLDRGTPLSLICPLLTTSLETLYRDTSLDFFSYDLLPGSNVTQ